MLSITFYLRQTFLDADNRRLYHHNLYFEASQILCVVLQCRV